MQKLYTNRNSTLISRNSSILRPLTRTVTYIDLSLQGKGLRESSVTHNVSHHRPRRGREPCRRLGQGKSGRQRCTATDRMDKRGTLDQEDTDVHESGCRILPTQPHVGPGDFQVTCMLRRAVNSEDVIKMSDGHRDVVIR